MFLEPVTKHPRGFTNVFLIAIHPITPESIDDPTFSHDRIFVLWGHQEVLDGIASFTMNLHSMPAAYLLEAFTQPSIIRYHNILVSAGLDCYDQFLWCCFFWLSFFV